jgi:tRNA1Val (adenine37-N6)-methyltransferase
MARNTHFQFKHFRVEQDRCAMKVCTDACVLGAWTDATGAGRLLDIGAGTGLLSLMVAQRFPSLRIDALELDFEAADQARENVANSPFAGRIRVIQGDIRSYADEEKYEAIVTNPPFFQADLRSPDGGVNRAHHAQEMTFGDLLAAVHRLLSEDGRWYVLLPVAESITLQKQAQAARWWPRRQLWLTHQPERQPFRILTAYERETGQTVTNPPEELFIYESDGKTYSSAFGSLLKDFYLVF